MKQHANSIKENWDNYAFHVADEERGIELIGGGEIYLKEIFGDREFSVSWLDTIMSQDKNIPVWNKFFSAINEENPKGIRILTHDCYQNSGNDVCNETFEFITEMWRETEQKGGCKFLPYTIPVRYPDDEEDITIEEVYFQRMKEELIVNSHFSYAVGLGKLIEKLVGSNNAQVFGNFVGRYCSEGWN